MNQEVAAKTIEQGNQIIIYLNDINDIISTLVLVLLGVATLIQILDMIGLWPKRWRDKLKLNRAQETIEVLESLGINFNQYRKSNATVGIPVDYSKETVIEKTRKNLEELKIDKLVSVGKIRQTELNYYIDLIGHTCDPVCAKAYARLLSSYWVDCIENTQLVKTPNIDFVVTPKGGSPILGYEFAKLLDKPFILHELQDRFIAKDDDMRKKFDCATIPPKGSTALIVDDSTTGGRMVLGVINDLKKYGYAVTDCLVVFEPQQKDARKKLSDQEVNLLSIVKTHEEMYKEL